MERPLTASELAPWEGSDPWISLSATVEALHAIARALSETDPLMRIVREELAPGASTTIPIAPVANGEFHLVWQWGDAPGEPQWNGHFDGSGATARYRFRIEDAGRSLCYLTDNELSPRGATRWPDRGMPISTGGPARRWIRCWLISLAMCSRPRARPR